MTDMYIDEEQRDRSRRFVKVIKTVGIILWVAMIMISIFLTSRSLVIIT